MSVWTIFVIAYVWIFHIDPPHDDEYAKWLFLSIFDTALPWVCCSVTLTLVLLSLDSQKRPRRRWIWALWALVVLGLALIDLRPLLHHSTIPDPVWYKPVWHVTTAVEEFAFRHLLPAFFILAACLWIERKLVRRGLLT